MESAETNVAVAEITIYSDMDPRKVMEIHYECERILSLQNYFSDHGQALKYLELLTDDAILDAKVRGGASGATNVTLVGKEAIRKALEVRERQAHDGKLSIHKKSDFLLTSVSEAEASAVFYQTTYIADGKPGEGIPGRIIADLTAPRHVAEVRCRFVKTEKGWKMAHQEVIFLFDSDAANKSLTSTYSQFAPIAPVGVQAKSPND